MALTTGQEQIKLPFNMAFALLMLFFLIPVFIVAALLIKLTSPGPVFFRQQRVGRDGTLFSIYKFRTMVVNAEKIGAGYYFEENDPRITKVGRYLRMTSLDELPELFNVIKGEMSLVGPRPTLPYQVEKYTPEQRLRLRVRPGITGWAQVNGRNNLTWSQRIALDNWYIDNYSFLLDCKILLMTLKVVLLREGVRHDQTKADIEDFGPHAPVD